MIAGYHPVEIEREAHRSLAPETKIDGLYNRQPARPTGRLILTTLASLRLIPATATTPAQVIRPNTVQARCWNSSAWKVRLSGARADVDTVTAVLAGHYEVLDRYGPRPNSYEPGERVYLTIRTGSARAAGPDYRA